MSNPPVPNPPPSDRQVPGRIQQCAIDVRAELAGLSSQLRTISDDQIGARPRVQIDTALRHAEAMERLIDGVLAQVSGENGSLDTTGAVPVRVGMLVGRRLVVVDDAVSTLRFLSSLLTSEGASVAMARSGAEALAHLATESCDLLIVDATMPGLSGAQVIRALRARPDAQSAVPALAMTADRSVQRHDELIAAGASRVVTKPLPDPAEILRIVDRLLKAQPVPAIPAPGRAEDVPLFDPGPLTRVYQLAGPEVGREILDRLMLDLIETLARLDRVGAGIRADLGTVADMGELRATAHVLIALAGTAGAQMLLRQVQLLDLRLQTESQFGLQSGHPSGLPRDLGPFLADIRLLTRGAVAAIARLDLPDQGSGRSP